MKVDFWKILSSVLNRVQDPSKRYFHLRYLLRDTFFHILVMRWMGNFVDHELYDSRITSIGLWCPSFVHILACQATYEDKRSWDCLSSIPRELGSKTVLVVATRGNCIFYLAYFYGKQISIIILKKILFKYIM